MRIRMVGALEIQSHQLLWLYTVKSRLCTEHTSQYHFAKTEIECLGMLDSWSLYHIIKKYLQKPGVLLPIRP
jgi:hypothetical protein